MSTSSTSSSTGTRATAALGTLALAAAGVVLVATPAAASEEHSPAQMIAKITGPGSINDTDSRWNVGGTDLGLMWDNGAGQIMFAIGDTFATAPAGGPDWRSNGLLRSSDADFTTGMMLDSAVLDGDGDAAEIIPSLKDPGTEHTTIPTAGIAVGDTQYLAFMSVRQWGEPGEWDTNYSRIAYSEDNGETWNDTDGPEWTNTEAGDNNFQMVSFVRGQGDGYIYMHGTPNGRLGAAQVARVPEEEILDKDSYTYWDGAGWAPEETAAVDVVAPNVSELSVQYHEHSGQWLMMYLNEEVDVVVRTAPAPEGPWGQAQIVASFADYPGLYSPYMHPWNEGPTVHFMMSLWEPYNIYQLAFDLDTDGQITRPNLIADPSFERAGESGAVSDVWSCTGNCGIDRDINWAHSGSNQAWMRHNTGWIDVHQQVPVEPNTTYDLSAFVTTGGEPAQGALGVRQVGPGAQVLAETEFTELPVYERQALTFNSGPNTAVEVYVGSNLDGDRWVQIDDFTLIAGGTEAEPDPPSVDALRASLEAYTADGAVAGPIAHQLAGALDQVERHLDDGRTQPAHVALDRFIRHLDNPKRPDTLTPEAASHLRHEAVALREATG
ncbi:DUF4185 domain-containing protein [Pseudactinotalea sp. Z1732]|uniref:DUF4185 domain-containing protein n=1 Tax=Pseudactinotalea sp. Z1732 TaxID=3413026 RepID=UPI003C7ECE9A